MKVMTQNVDSRGDKEEAAIERMEFVSILMHMGQISACSEFCNEVCAPYFSHLLVGSDETW